MKNQPLRNKKIRRENKTSLPLRHSPSVKTVVDAIAARENIPPSTLYRTIFNAGLKSLYQIELVNNQIVN
jgi:hypothetical protein